MQDGQYAVTITLQTNLGGSVVVSTLFFGISFNDKKRSEATAIAFERSKEEAFRMMKSTIPNLLNVKKAAELSSNIIFMSMELE